MTDLPIVAPRPDPVRRPDSDYGMACPHCGSEETGVRDSRPADRNTIRRRRICNRCSGRFTTYEIGGDIETLIRMATEIDTLVRNMRPEDVTLLPVIISEMRRRGRQGG